MYFSDGEIYDLGCLPGYPSAWANAINDNGTIAGIAYTNSTEGGPRRPVAWENGVVRDLGTLGGSQGVAWGINNAGQIVGSAATEGNAGEHAFLWEDGEMRDLGSPESGWTLALALNDVGQVVGRSYSTRHAFLWDEVNGMQDLGLLPGREWSEAADVNNSGTIVGSSWTVTGGRAVVWQDGYIFDLNLLIPADSGWSLYGANGINQDGLIVGSGGYNGQAHAFLLTPIPEPTTLALFGFGVVALLGRRRGRLAAN